MTKSQTLPPKPTSLLPKTPNPHTSRVNLDVPPRPCLFVDRDGILCRLVHYQSGWDSPQHPDDTQLVPGIDQILLWANTTNLLVVEITNQPGVAKGKMSPATTRAIESGVHEHLAGRKVHVDHTYTCPHHPYGMVPELTQNCNCRKPQPGLLLKAAKELEIDLHHSLFLGDKATDIKAGHAAGTHTVLYLHTDDDPQKVAAAHSSTPDFKSASLPEILQYIQAFFAPTYPAQP